MVKYLFEIKNRSALLFLVWLSTALVCYGYKEVILFFLIKPYIYLSSDVSYFIFTNVTEIFSTYFSLITFASFQFACWYFLYYTFVFISPALFNYEFKYLDFFFKLVTFLFIFSFLFSNYILIPLTWNFFLSLNPVSFAKSVYFEARLREYLSFYINVYCFCLAYCQAFSILFIFIRNVYSKKSFIKIKKFRKLYYYIFVIFSTLLSPPDIITQLLLSLSLLISYELVLFIWMYALALKRLVR